MEKIDHYVDSVKTFMQACDQPLFDSYKVTPRVLVLRNEMIVEEARETLEACRDHDLVEVADGIADLLYVVAGGLLEIKDPAEVYAFAMYENYAKNHHEVDVFAKPGTPESFDGALEYLNFVFGEMEAAASDTKSSMLEATEQVVSLGLDIIDYCRDYFNLPLREVFDEVQASNMSKVMPDGKVLKNEAGKVQKPEGFFRPNLQPILDAHYGM